MQNFYKKVVKRIFDIIISGLAIIITSPIMLVTAILIKLTSDGPVFFAQDRIGYHGKVFKILKFRSMVVGAEKQGSGVYSEAGDARVTTVGRFIRKLSIDELPQFFNVFVGQMSFIGPRPPLTYHPWTYDRYSKNQVRMFDTRPGLSGWAQVNGRKGVEWHERINLNVYYVEHESFWFDLKIIFMTIGKVFKSSDNENVGVTVDKNSPLYEPPRGDKL